MYMSPEQIRSERIDDRADIYSLGVTLYEMLSGQPPYTADSALTLMMMVLNDPLPDLHESREGLPESLLAVVHKALTKEPAERFQTMAEMAAALRQVQSEIANLPLEPAATLVDEPEVRPAGPTTVEDKASEEEIAGVSQVGQPEAVSPIVGLRELEGEKPSAPTLQDAPLEESPAPSAPSAVRAWFTARQGYRRILLAAASLLVLAVVVTGGLIYLNARKPPGLQLVPISLPTESVNAQTAQAVVSLGRWETDSLIEKLTFSPDGSLLGTAHNRDWVRFSSYRYYNALWQVQAGSLQKYLLGHTQWVSDAAFSPNGQFFGSVSEDGILLLWGLSDGSLVRKIESSHDGLTSLAFSPNNMLLAAGSWEGSVSLWQVSNGNLLRTLQEVDYGLRDVEFSPDGTLLAAASDDNSILVWRVSDGRLVYKLQDHTAPVYKAVFSPDGSLLASASEDHTIKLWMVSDSSLQRNLPGHTEAVYDVAFSPDGSLLASGSGDGEVRLWQVSDGQLLGKLTEQSDSVKSVAFSPDGHLLVSGTADGVIQFWGISEAIPLINQ
jgi:hypothetical protein